MKQQDCTEESRRCNTTICLQMAPKFLQRVLALTTFRRLRIIPEDLPLSWHVATEVKLAGLCVDLSSVTGKTVGYDMVTVWK